MSDKVNIVLSPEYANHLELLKQVIPSETGEEITDDSKMVEVLIDSFMAFIQEQAEGHAYGNDEEWGCCGGGWHEHHHDHEHNHEHWHCHDHWKEEWGCCKH